MDVDAGHAVKEFLADGLARDGGASNENFFNYGCVAWRRLVGCEPGRITGAGASPGDVVHVLDGDGQPRERAGGFARNGGDEVVRDEEGARPRLVVALRPCIHAEFRPLVLRGGLTVLYRDSGGAAKLRWRPIPVNKVASMPLITAYWQLR